MTPHFIGLSKITAGEFRGSIVRPFAVLSDWVRSRLQKADRIGLLRAAVTVAMTLEKGFDF